jgi:hypothetical protein
MRIHPTARAWLGQRDLPFCMWSIVFDHRLTRVPWRAVPRVVPPGSRQWGRTAASAAHKGEPEGPPSSHTPQRLANNSRAVVTASPSGTVVPFACIAQARRHGKSVTQPPVLPRRAGGGAARDRTVTLQVGAAGATQPPRNHPPNHLPTISTNRLTARQPPQDVSSLAPEAMSDDKAVFQASHARGILSHWPPGSSGTYAAM